MDQTSARAKLTNASTHLERPNAAVETELAGPGRTAVSGANYDAGTGRHIVYLETVPDMTDAALRLSVVVGDVVHNLRSASDHVAWQAACANSPMGIPARPREIQFRLSSTTSCTSKGDGYFGATAWSAFHEWQPATDFPGTQ